MILTTAESLQNQKTSYGIDILYINITFLFFSLSQWNFLFTDTSSSLLTKGGEANKNAD